MGTLLKFALLGGAGYLLYEAYVKSMSPVSSALSAAAGVSGLGRNYVRPGMPMRRSRR